MAPNFNAANDREFQIEGAWREIWREPAFGL
jgi:muconolactone delta-isomerase